MYHIVYLTRNLVNSKFYVGVHSTYNLDDGYLGSGIRIKQAIKKYGKVNFQRIILHFCLTEQEALDWESIIVDMNFVNRKDTYNMCPGGFGGPSMIKKGKTYIEMYGPEKGQLMMEQNKLKRLNQGPMTDSHLHNFKYSRLGKKSSKETRDKISQANKGKPKTQDHRMKLSEAKLGKTRRKDSAETCAKRAAANVGKHSGEEHQKQRVESFLRNVHFISVIYAYVKLLRKEIIFN